jgi:hypothetical protein
MEQMTMPRIIRIPILPFGMVNAHLIHHADGCILVDAGLPGTEHKIEKVLVKHGISFKDIKLIVVTHAHVIMRETRMHYESCVVRLLWHTLTTSNTIIGNLK